MTSVPGASPDVRIGDWLKEGWNIVTPNLGTFVLASLIYNLILVTCVGGLILYGPLTCGFYLMVFDYMKGRKVELGRLFCAFEFFGDSFFPGFIFFLLTLTGITLAGSLIGLVILLFLQASFLFTFQLVAERVTGSVDAISRSFDKVKQNFWQFVLFALVLTIIQTAGYVTIIGLLITTPVVVASLAAAYRDVFGITGAQTIESADKAP